MSTPRDWSAWLPPTLTSDWGEYSAADDKALAAKARPGEIYAARWGAGDEARVWECREDGDYVLVGMPGGGGPVADRWPCADPSPRGRLLYAGAVLVQAVGQPEPTDPVVLYAVPFVPVADRPINGAVWTDEAVRALRNRMARLPSQPNDATTDTTAYIRGFRRGLFRDPPPDQPCPDDADVMNAHSGDYSVGMQDGAKLLGMFGASK
jgi:hypothetical protein